MNSQDEASPKPNLSDSPEGAATPAPVPDPAGSAALATAAVNAAAAGPGSPSAGMEQALERLGRELLLERRKERRWNLTFRLGWFAVVLMAVWLLFSQRGHSNAPTGAHTALIEVRGEIAAGSEASAEQLNSALKAAFEDVNSVAVVLRINSPGGSPVQAGIVNDEIKRLKGLHKKKLYAVVEEICASGAYYIAVAADEIFVDKASLVGSIGVLMDGFGFAGTMDKLGVERRLLTAGQNKGMLDPFSPQNEHHKAYAQAMIDQVHQQFIKVVQDGRGARLKQTPDTFSGLFWNGEEAIKQGLADRYGSLDFVAREVAKAPEVVDYTPKENVAERLAKRFGASLGEGAMKALKAVSLPH